ncbi:MAG: hypothetical protein R3F48_13625 [Candidatus Zixiibacteriota bacterium]
MFKSLPNLSLVDLLSYIFPGMITLMALYLLLLELPIDQKLFFDFDKNAWALGLISIPVSYFLGMVASNILQIRSRWGDNIQKIKEIDSPLDNKYLQGYKDDLIHAYSRIFNVDKPWSRETYYFIRAFVRNNSPVLAEYANRQVVLRHIRKNCIPPIILLMLDSVIWSILRIVESQYILGMGIGLFSFITGGLIIISLYCGMKYNRTLEVRDYCMGFLLLAQNIDQGSEKVETI